MEEATIGSGRQEALRDINMLLDLAISRSRGSASLDGETKDLVRGRLEAAKQELGRFAEPYGASESRRVRANGDLQRR